MRKGSPPPEGAPLHSAGGVVVMGSGGDLRVAVMRSGFGTWVFPKGGIEPGESPEEAARREIEEEVGLGGLALVAELGGTEHEYEQAGRRHRKHVDWFVFQAEAGAELSPNPAESVVDCGWFTPKQSLSLLSHADQRRILRRALSLLG